LDRLPRRKRSKMAAQLNQLTRRSRPIRNMGLDESWDKGIRLVFFTSRPLSRLGLSVKEADLFEARRSGLLHREDGPARIETYADGSLYFYGYYRNGQEHREDGPALYNSYKTRYWFINGQRHRTDGPAVENEDGTAEWWLHGYRFTFPEWENFKGLTESELIGHPDVESWIVLGARGIGSAPGFYSRKQREIEEQFYDQVAEAVANDPIAQASDPLVFA
jgi:hypothetical protein